MNTAKPGPSAYNTQHISGVDWCAKQHAQATADLIADYWQQRGVNVVGTCIRD